MRFRARVFTGVRLSISLLSHSPSTSIFMHSCKDLHSIMSIFQIFTSCHLQILTFPPNTQGIEPSVRKEAWRYLLNYFPFNSTDIERMELKEVHIAISLTHTHSLSLILSKQQREKEYWQMKNQWQSFTEAQEKRFSKWREAKTLISESHD